MLLEDLKILIKDFEGVLSKDIRFKEDMYFKNQVKIIYGQKEKIKNVMVPLLLANLSNTKEVDEMTRLKNRIKYLEKVESMPCSCSHYEHGTLPDSDEITKAYNSVTAKILTTASEDDDFTTLYSVLKGKLKTNPIQDQIKLIKKLLPERVKGLSDSEIEKKIQKYK
jgi:hypothetical protein